MFRILVLYKLIGYRSPHNFCFSSFRRCCPLSMEQLPSGICACSSSHTFCGPLKTHCFDQPFSSP